ncbi:MAG: hypothetical protein ACTHMQ_03070 [Protaetiibacter sp.]
MVSSASSEPLATSVLHLRLASRHDWDASWLNFEVTRADALPTLGRAVEWDTIYDQAGITIQVASKEALLAMKLRANRPGRDTRDTRFLLALCDVKTLQGDPDGRGNIRGRAARGAGLSSAS